MISVYGDLKGENYKTFVSFAMEHSDAMMLIYCGYGYPLKRADSRHSADATSLPRRLQRQQ